MLVVIEGADGAGKTSVGKVVAEALKAKLIHFPNDEGETGPLIRSYLRKEWAVMRHDEEMHYHGVSELDDQGSALAFQSLHVANRMERMAELNLCVGAATFHAVAVRYWQSGWVYGQLDGLDRRWLMEVHAGMAKPDVNILLDVEAHVGLQRQQDRDGGKVERYEGQIEFCQNVVRLYRELWKDVTLRQPFLRPNSVDGGWPVVDARKSLNDVLVAVGNLVGV